MLSLSVTVEEPGAPPSNCYLKPLGMLPRRAQGQPNHLAVITGELGQWRCSDSQITRAERGCFAIIWSCPSFVTSLIGTGPSKAVKSVEVLCHWKPVIVRLWQRVTCARSYQPRASILAFDRYRRL